MSTSRLLLSFTTCLTLATLAFASDEPTLEQRLEKLAETLEVARVDAHVPGMSIAIVKGDKVIWTHGFGLADVASERPAGEGTLYAIGSTTKAFTATLVGTLVDGGEMSWDDPVAKFLPYLDLQVRSDDEDAACTLRDLLSHRSGFARMPILWVGGKATREEVLRTAAGAEPLDDLRAGFHYSNVMYLAAGEAAAVAGGSTWDEMIAERFFGPLGMSSSSLSVAVAQEDPRFAVGYKWDEEDGQFVQEDTVSLNSIAPAGAINANVVDMAQWLRLQLGRGTIDGKQIVSAERILETWEPQIEIGNGVSYGLGWMLQEHDGRKIVEHGGNIAGFSAQVGLMPEEDLGYVLLMNVNLSPLQQGSLPIVFDALLDEWPDENDGDAKAAAPVDIDFDDYVGTYIANFASFRDEEFEVLVNGEKLALDIPSQRTFDLVEPGSDGKWEFALTDTIAVTFLRGDDDAVVGLILHQGGFSFEVPRAGIEQGPEVPAEQLQKYTGTYVRAKGGKQVEISIEQGWLAMLDKGNLLAFTTPDAKGHAALRARADWGATFKTDAEGSVDSFVFHGAAGDRLFSRLADSLDLELPTLEELLALRGTDARIAAQKAAGGVKFSGQVWVAQAGVRGTVTLLAQGTDRFAYHLDFGRFGQVDVVANGAKAWASNPMFGTKALKGQERAQAILGHPGAVEGDWSAFFDSIEVIRNDRVDGHAVHVVRLKKGDLPGRTYAVDAENGDVLRVKHIAIDRSMRVPITTTYFDFEERDGIRVPLRIVVENPATGRTEVTIESIETGIDFGDDVFELEE